MRKLLGSLASPYVRRIRMLKEAEGFDFEAVAVFTAEGQERLRQFAPTARVPILIDGETVVWDSLLITRYLTGEQPSLQTELKLNLINEANDAAIALFQFRKFKIDSSWTSVTAQNHQRRLIQILHHFDALSENGALQTWGLAEQWLYCMLEWFDFRSVFDWREPTQHLEGFLQLHETQPRVAETKPQ